MKPEDIAVKRVASTTGTLAGALEPRSRKRVASVLDRLVAPNVLPLSVRLDDGEVDTVHYVAQSADVARVPQT